MSNKVGGGTTFHIPHMLNQLERLIILDKIMKVA